MFAVPDAWVVIGPERLSCLIDFSALVVRDFDGIEEGTVPWFFLKAKVMLLRVALECMAVPIPKVAA